MVIVCINNYNSAKAGINGILIKNIVISRFRDNYIIIYNLKICTKNAILIIQGGDIMKKFKEFLFFIIPLMVLTALPIVLFSINHGDNVFIGNMQYIKLFINDDVFWNAILNTYGKAVLFSFAVPLILFALSNLKVLRFLKNRKAFYSLNIVLASLVSFFVLLVNKIRLFGLPMTVYDPSSLIADSPPPVTASISLYEIILALQIGVFTAFVFWLIERIISFVRNKKTSK